MIGSRIACWIEPARSSIGPCPDTTVRRTSRWSLVPQLIQQRNILRGQRCRQRLEVRVDVHRVLVRNDLGSERRHGTERAAQVADERLCAHRGGGDSCAVSATLAGVAVAEVAGILHEQALAVFGVPDGAADAGRSLSGRRRRDSRNAVGNEDQSQHIYPAYSLHVFVPRVSISAA